MFDVFDLMLYIHGKQLRSFQDGQLLNHTVPQAVYKYLVLILLPITDNLQRDPKKSPRTSILMVLFFKVSRYALHNHLAYFLLIGWVTLFYCGTP